MNAARAGGHTLEASRKEVEEAFAHELGLVEVESDVERIGGKAFLKIRVGRRAPIYERALLSIKSRLRKDNVFRGLIGLNSEPTSRLTISTEAKVLGAILTRSTRTIAQSPTEPLWGFQYVPFRNHEEAKAMQPATQLIVGRRGVGKSTLILKVVQSLQKSSRLCAVMDMQRFAHRPDPQLYPDVLSDLGQTLVELLSSKAELSDVVTELRSINQRLAAGSLAPERAVMLVNKSVQKATGSLNSDLFLFLDDFHLISEARQAGLLDLIHGCLKGARAWLKVIGIESLLKAYDASERKGLQVPGDAQRISLDLSLVNPEAAEQHLRAILLQYLQLVGLNQTGDIIHDAALERLVWANAGVARDFLQMFNRALEHAAQNERKAVTLTDVNLALCEFGDQKMNELEQDAFNSKVSLERVLAFIENYCLARSAKSRCNAFLIRNESSEEHRAVQALKDLRLVHLLHQTITPHKAGERYEAYMIDYSRYTGFRRRPGIREVKPKKGRQFQAAELRKLPALPRQFLNVDATVET